MAELNPSRMFIGDVEYVTTAAAAERIGADVTTDMVKDWVKRGLLKPAGRYGGRSNIFRVIDVAHAEMRTRTQRRGRTRRAGELQKIETAGHNLPTGDVADPAQEQEPPRCTLTLNNGRDCRNLADLDAPFDICQAHLRQAYKYWQDYLEARYAGNPGMPFDPQLDRSREIPPEPTFVYYIQFGTRIKIGYTTNIRQRLGNLPYDEVLALEPGSRDLEQVRHRQFMAHRVGAGEWFFDNPDLRSHIKMLVRHYGPADVQMQHLDDQLWANPVMAPGEDGVLRIITVHPGVPEDSVTHIHISKVEKK